MGSANQRCVLVFARSAAAEARTKQLPGAEPLFRHTAARIARAVRGLAGVDLVFAGAPSWGRSLGAKLCIPQTEGDFSSKLSGAFASAAQAGYRQIVAVGIDSPELSASHLLEAFQQLKTHSTVLGPSRDGGVYLLGYAASKRSDGISWPRAFERVRWQTSHTYADLRSLWSEAAVLGALADLDAAHDLQRFAHVQDPSLRSLIRALLGTLRRALRNWAIIIAPRSIRVPSPRCARAPPLA